MSCNCAQSTIQRHIVFRDDPYGVYPTCDINGWSHSCEDLIIDLINRKVITKAGRYSVMAIPRNGGQAARWPFIVSEPTGLVVKRGE